MKTFLPSRLRGFSLPDVLVAVTLTSFLVVLLAQFVGDVLKYSQFVAQHQQIRSETFALVNNALSSIIREAVAIDYSDSSETQLALFMDKYETPSKRVVISVEQDLSALPGGSRNDLSQLVLERGSRRMYLNSPLTFVESFRVEYPENPRSFSGDALQSARAQQPMVRVTLKSRYQHAEGERGRSEFGWYENPQISYAGAYTLRNYSFSNLRAE